LSWPLAATIDWFVGGAVVLVLGVFAIYRALTRISGWGPSDT
jgi:hypothetical protein